MITATLRKKKAVHSARIRPEFLPDSAVYGTFADREYVMIPVEDFGGWLEDIEDRLAVEDAGNDPSPGIPLEELLKKTGTSRKAAKK